MKYCSNCGTKIPEEGNFCSLCGKGIRILKKKSKISTKSILGMVAGVFLFGIILTTIFIVAMESNSITGHSIKTVIKPVDPYIIDFECKQVNTGLFEDTRAELTVIVGNKGGNGPVTILGKSDQEGSNFDYTEQKTIYLTKGQTQTITFNFDASKFRDGNCYAKIIK